MSRETLLMVADSEHCADMLYAVGMFVPDPFIYLRHGGRPLLVLSDLEIDRARAQAPHCRILSLSQYQKKLRKAGIKKPALRHVICDILRERGVKKVFVPHLFPRGLARELQKLKIRIKPKRGPVFPERQIKSPEEVKKISAALMMAEVCLDEGIQALRSCKLDRKRRL